MSVKILTVEKTIYKAVSAAVALAGAVVAQQLLHGHTQNYVVEGILLANVFTTWLAPYLNKVTTSVVSDEVAAVVVPADNAKPVV